MRLLTVENCAKFCTRPQVLYKSTSLCTIETCLPINTQSCQYLTDHDWTNDSQRRFVSLFTDSNKSQIRLRLPEACKCYQVNNLKRLTFENFRLQSKKS